MGYANDIENVIRCLAVTTPNSEPYSMVTLPAQPGEEARIADGYGLLMPGMPNEQAETDQYPDFHTKTELVRDPDYGQGQTMNVGVNV